MAVPHERPDPFRQPILIIRWGTTTVGLALASPRLLDGDLPLAAWVLVIITYTVFRTRRPIAQQASTRVMVALTVEAALTGLAAASTGYFLSPLALSTLTAVSIAGFVSGFAVAIRLAIASCLAVGTPMLLTSQDLADDATVNVQWAVELILVGTVASYARRISGDAEERRTEALDRLGRLIDANDLLFNLHQVAQDLPASLDLSEVLDSTLDRLQDLVDFDSAAVLLLEDADNSWHVARRKGGRTISMFTPDELPDPVAAATRSRSVIAEPNLLRSGGPGLGPRAGSGLYAALVSRGFLVGVLTIEHPDAHHFTDRDRELLAGYAEPAALAIDNARWFARLRTVGADEERTRIARDLHDRIGQSLAYLAFELDRIVRKDGKGTRVSDDLSGLREDVRGVVREVRDTLYDLRTDVSDEKTIDNVLAEFVGRVRERTSMEIVVRIDETVRMPRLQERELWRIVQEAIVNAERHSNGRHLDIFWYSNGHEAVIEVRDDGDGMPDGQSGRLDSYGMLGMRERAASIGAQLAVKSTPGRGTTVRATLRNA